MSLAATVRAMASAGCTADQIAAVVEAYVSTDETAKNARRAKDAERKRRQRHAESRDVTRTDADTVDTPLLPSPSPSSFPPDPLTNNPLPLPSAPKNNSSKRPSADFEKFWQRYPRKVAKDSAAKAFAKAILRTDLETVLAGLETYIREKPAYADFAHAATWLNEGRWSDEYSPSNSAPRLAYTSPQQPLAFVPTPRVQNTGMSDEDRAEMTRISQLPLDERRDAHTRFLDQRRQKNG